MFTVSSLRKFWYQDEMVENDYNSEFVIYEFFNAVQGQFGSSDPIGCFWLGIKIIVNVWFCVYLSSSSPTTKCKL